MTIRKSTICMVVSMIGVAATAYFVKKDTERASQLHMDEAKKRTETTCTDVSAWERFKIDAPVYKRSALAIAVTYASIIIGHKLDTAYIAGITATLSGAVVAANEKYNDLKVATKELVGEDTFHDIEDKIVSKKYPDGDFPENNHKTEVYNKLFYDEFTDTWFWSNDVQVYDAIYKLNRNFQLRDWTSIAEWLEFLCIENVDDKKLKYARYIWETQTFWEDGMTPWIDLCPITERKTDNGETYYRLSFFIDPWFTMCYDNDIDCLKDIRTVIYLDGARF